MILKEREQLNEKVKEGVDAIYKERADKDELCKIVKKSEEVIAKQKADKEELGRKVREQEEAIAREKADKEELDRKVKEKEETIAKEKADKEAERLEKEKVQNELETKEKEISDLKNELTLKRKLDQEQDSVSAKNSKTEEKARFLEKCNDELKCSICDDIFIRVSLLVNSTTIYSRILNIPICCEFKPNDNFFSANISKLWSCVLSGSYIVLFAIA